jgi:hypothetical protein
MQATLSAQDWLGTRKRHQAIFDIERKYFNGKLWFQFHVATASE